MRYHSPTRTNSTHPLRHSSHGSSWRHRKALAAGLICFWAALAPAFGDTPDPRPATSDSGIRDASGERARALLWGGSQEESPGPTAQRTIGGSSASNGAAAAPAAVTPSTSNWIQDPIAKFAEAGGKGFKAAQTFRDNLGKNASEMVAKAVGLIGVPYQWGGESAENGFDCSGFVRYVLETTVGLVVPRNAAAQAKDPVLQRVARSELQPGDLVFFNTRRHVNSHVGLYVGDDKFVHAPRLGSQIRMDALSDSYWGKRYDGARRPPTSDPRVRRDANSAVR